MSTTDTSLTGSTSLLSLFRGSLTTKLQEQMLKKVDTDASGDVSKTEFQAALEKAASKLGVDVGEQGDELYTMLDADSSGSLDGKELGSLVDQFLMPADTESLALTRGDEGSFKALDSDGDGLISMAEFGIQPQTTTTTTTTTMTTTTTTTVGGGPVGSTPSSGSAQAIAAALLAASDQPAPPPAQGHPGNEVVVDNDEQEEVVATAPTDETDTNTDTETLAQDKRLTSLMAAADTDGDGKLSSAELNALAAKMSMMAEAASKRYNDTAIASMNSRQNASGSGWRASA